jgi:hypothetical protein
MHAHIFQTRTLELRQWNRFIIHITKIEKNSTLRDPFNYLGIKEKKRKSLMSWIPIALAIFPISALLI